jgi:hypothetical protein
MLGPRRLMTTFTEINAFEAIVYAAESYFQQFLVENCDRFQQQKKNKSANSSIQESLERCFYGFHWQSRTSMMERKDRCERQLFE